MRARRTSSLLSLALAAHVLAFGSCGSPELKRQTDQLQSEVASLQSSLSSLRREVEAVRVAVDKHQVTIAGQQATLTELATDVAENFRRLALLEKGIGDLVLQVRRAISPQ